MWILLIFARGNVIEMDSPNSQTSTSERDISQRVAELLASGLTYSQAVEKLNEIGRELATGKISLEQLESKVLESDLLLRFCTAKIGIVGDAVGQITKNWKPLLEDLNE